MQDGVLHVVGQVQQVGHPHRVHQLDDVLEARYVARQRHEEEPAPQIKKESYSLQTPLLRLNLKKV